MTAARTQPLPPNGCPHITYRRGQRISALVDMPDGPRRLVGDVVDTSWWIFTVRWAEGHGTAIYAHGHEPDHLRHATPADETDALTRTTRATVAAELARLADRHPQWPAPVRHTLRRRAAELTGDTR